MFPFSFLKIEFEDSKSFLITVLFPKTVSVLLPGVVHFVFERRVFGSHLDGL